MTPDKINAIMVGTIACLLIPLGLALLGAPPTLFWREPPAKAALFLRVAGVLVLLGAVGCFMWSGRSPR
ncbi:MAG: hypothetical protein FJX76_21495 [Armatimonadetes bacterium]|nr:hypothetical protein [Armatimonadota bacterium]